MYPYNQNFRPRSTYSARNYHLGPRLFGENTNHQIKNPNMYRNHHHTYVGNSQYMRSHSVNRYQNSDNNFYDGYNGYISFDKDVQYGCYRSKNISHMREISISDNYGSALCRSRIMKTPVQSSNGNINSTQSFPKSPHMILPLTPHKESELHLSGESNSITGLQNGTESLRNERASLTPINDYCNKNEISKAKSKTADIRRTLSNVSKLPTVSGSSGHVLNKQFENPSAQFCLTNIHSQNISKAVHQTSPYSVFKNELERNLKNIGTLHVMGNKHTPDKIALPNVSKSPSSNQNPLLSQNLSYSQTSNTTELQNCCIPTSGIRNFGVSAIVVSPVLDNRNTSFFSKKEPQFNNNNHHLESNETNISTNTKSAIALNLIHQARSQNKYEDNITEDTNQDDMSVSSVDTIECPNSSDLSMKEFDQFVDSKINNEIVDKIPEHYVNIGSYIKKTTSSSDKDIEQWVNLAVLNSTVKQFENERIPTRNVSACNDKRYGENLNIVQAKSEEASVASESKSDIQSSDIFNVNTTEACNKNDVSLTMRNISTCTEEKFGEKLTTQHTIPKEKKSQIETLNFNMNKIEACYAIASSGEQVATKDIHKSTTNATQLSDCKLQISTFAKDKETKGNLCKAIIKSVDNSLPIEDHVTSSKMCQKQNNTEYNINNCIANIISTQEESFEMSPKNAKAKCKNADECMCFGKNIEAKLQLNNKQSIKYKKPNSHKIKCSSMKPNFCEENSHLPRKSTVSPNTISITLLEKIHIIRNETEKYDGIVNDYNEKHRSNVVEKEYFADDSKTFKSEKRIENSEKTKEKYTELNHSENLAKKRKRTEDYPNVNNIKHLDKEVSALVCKNITTEELKATLSLNQDLNKMLNDAEIQNMNESNANLENKSRNASKALNEVANSKVNVETRGSFPKFKNDSDNNDDGSCTVIRELDMNVCENLSNEIFNAENEMQSESVIRHTSSPFQVKIINSISENTHKNSNTDKVFNVYNEPGSSGATEKLANNESEIQLLNKHSLIAEDNSLQNHMQTGTNIASTDSRFIYFAVDVRNSFEEEHVYEEKLSHSHSSEIEKYILKLDYDVLNQCRENRMLKELSHLIISFNSDITGICDTLFVNQIYSTICSMWFSKWKCPSETVIKEFLKSLCLKLQKLSSVDELEVAKLQMPIKSNEMGAFVNSHSDLLQNVECSSCNECDEHCNSILTQTSKRPQNSRRTATEPESFYEQERGLLKITMNSKIKQKITSMNKITKSKKLVLESFTSVEPCPNSSTTYENFIDLTRSQHDRTTENIESSLDRFNNNRLSEDIRLFDEPESVHQNILDKLKEHNESYEMERVISSPYCSYINTLVQSDDAQNIKGPIIVDVRSQSVDSEFSKESPFVVDVRTQSVDGEYSEGVYPSQASGNKEDYDNNIIYCTICNKIAEFKCSKCGYTCYCSIECQRKHWDSGHAYSCAVPMHL